jgi:Homodimerisation domain of SGTA
MLANVAIQVYTLLSKMSQQQKLVLSIIDFLNKSIEDGTVKEDDRESLEVASTLNVFWKSSGLILPR